jgi:SAM-dependent methyltransferase
MPYQTFDDVRGDSDTAAKLRAIVMPKQLDGKRVLDLGCNEGFFSIEAKRRGAAEVVGIDERHDFIERARSRSKEVTFLAQSWDVLPEGKFDLILMLSALHYEPQPRELLRRIYDKLSDDGLFILEAGAVREPGRSLRWTHRGVGPVQHPTWDTLVDLYLEPFVVRFIGGSVIQRADPVPRWVFHCTRRKPLVLLLAGRSGEGKSCLAHELARQPSALGISTDLILARRIRSKAETSPFLAAVQEWERMALTKSFAHLVRHLEDAGFGGDLVDAILEQIPLDERLIVVEGYGLTDAVVDELVARLEGAAFVWVVRRARTGEACLAIADETEAELQRMGAENERLRGAVERVVSAAAEDAGNGSEALIAEVDRLRREIERRTAELAVARGSASAEREQAARAEQELSAARQDLLHLQRRSVRFAMAAANVLRGHPRARRP